MTTLTEELAAALGALTQRYELYAGGPDAPHAGEHDRALLKQARAALSAFLAALKEDGLKVVASGPLAETIARALCSQGVLGPDNMVSIHDPNDAWGDTIGEQPLWQTLLPEAHAIIDSAAPPAQEPAS